MRAITLAGSLVLQCGVGFGLVCAGLLVPVALPEIPELRILPPTPRFRDAVKIIAASVEAVAGVSSMSALVTRRFVYRPPTDAPAIGSTQAFSEMPTVAASGDGIPAGVVEVIGFEQLAPPPPAQPNVQPPSRIAVGGNVLSAKMLNRVQPAYPQMARAARIEGVVQLLGVITREGRIDTLRVLSGHPLLVQAALEAVRQWVYSPTYLNGVAVEVQAPIEVRFTLSR